MIRTVSELIARLQQFAPDALVCGGWEGVYRAVVAVDRAFDGTAVIDVDPEGRMPGNNDPDESTRFEIGEDGMVHATIAKVPVKVPVKAPVKAPVEIPVPVKPGDTLHVSKVWLEKGTEPPPFVVKADWWEG